MEANEYAAFWMSNRIFKGLKAEKHQARLRKCADFVDGNSYVDVGCGCGHSTNIMKSFRPGDWNGIDFANQLILDARKNFPQINFVFVNGINYLMDMARFDGVVCSEVIEHVQDDKLLAKGLWNITDKNLIVTTPCHGVGDPGHLRLYNEKILRELFSFVDDLTIERDKHFFYIMCRRVQ